jgi:site-specific recombinase XerD
MRATGGSLAGIRLRALLVVMWRTGLRISEALALAETDLDSHRGSMLVRHGKGGTRGTRLEPAFVAAACRPKWK